MLRMASGDLLETLVAAICHPDTCLLAGVVLLEVVNGDGDTSELMVTVGSNSRVVGLVEISRQALKVETVERLQRRSTSHRRKNGQIS